MFNDISLVKKLINYLPVGVFYTDEIGNCIYVNQKWCEISGLNKEESLNGGLYDCIHPNDLEYVKKETEKLKLKKTEVDITYRIINKENLIRTINVKTIPICNEKNDIMFFMGVIVDLTEQKQIENDLRAKEDELISIISSTDDLIFEHDSNSTYLNVWAKTEKSLFFKKEELVGKKVTEVFKNELGIKLSTSIKKVAETGENLTIRYQSVLENDNTWFEANIMPVFKEEKLTDKILCSVKNITEKVKMEKVLKEKSERLELVVKASNDGIWDWNLESNEIYFSPRFKEMFGYNDNELPNTLDTWSNLILPNDKERALDYLDRFINGKTSEFNQIQRYYHKNNSIVYINCKAILIKNDTGKGIRLVGVHTDITKQIEFEEIIIKAKQSAEIASKAKSDFLSTMSHEIRTPLNGIIGMSNLLIQDKPKEYQIDNLKTLKFSAENLLSIVNDILDFTKIEEGKISLEFLEFDILELAKNIKRAYSVLAEEKNNTINLLLDSRIDTLVIGDQVRISQILNNLLSNALKFTENGTITIQIIVKKVENDFLDLEISVIDTGIGIEEDKLDLVFERFTQASSDTTRKYGGTGLGLTIIKKLLELQGSKINLESQFGKGSRFYFSLSLKQSNKKIKEQTIINFIEKNKKNMDINILLVEDNKINLKVATKFIEKWGFKVETAENGLISLNKITNKAFDIVLMDLQMPEMDGYTATEIIRKTNSNIPIIALTASATTEDIEKTKKIGFNDFIVKPFNPDDLYSKIIKYTSV